MTQNEQESPYFFRAYVEGDLNHIQYSWADSYYKSGGYKTQMSPIAFNLFHRPMRERFFQRPTTTVIVCASKENEDHILGWIAVETVLADRSLILHYLHVKPALRGEGIGRELIKRGLPESKVFYTHRTTHALQIIREKVADNDTTFKDWYYLPHLI